MKKWNCKVCGYTHEGDEPPKKCPRCGAPQSQFYRKNRNCVLSLLALAVILTLSIYLLVGCSQKLSVDNTAVATLVLSRYMGKWYEVARLDHRFERGMQQCTATYLPQANGTIKVVNQGLKNGEWKISEGKAKLTDKQGLLRVSFFGPFYSDYRILMLAPDYSYALVGGDNDNYLWILSRTPQLPKQARDQLLAEANRRGYNTSALIWVNQNNQVDN